jgi:hypothetical protein
LSQKVILFFADHRTTTLKIVSRIRFVPILSPVKTGES